jgi:peptidoglycan/LPS O-acetylase OafA/YrhL
VLAVALLPAVAYRNDTDHTSLVIVAGTGLTLVLLTGVVTRPDSAVGWLLASAPLRWLGERSYSIYLWNVLARITVLRLFGHSVLGDIVWVAMFVVLAEASFRLVERPLRARLARRSGPYVRAAPATHATSDRRDPTGPADPVSRFPRRVRSSGRHRASSLRSAS